MRLAAACLLVVALALPAVQPLMTSDTGTHGCRCGCASSAAKACGCCPARPAPGTVCVSDGGCGGSTPVPTRIDRPTLAALLPDAPRLLHRLDAASHAPRPVLARASATRTLPDPVPRPAA